MGGGATWECFCGCGARLARVQWCGRVQVMMEEARGRGEHPGSSGPRWKEGGQVLAGPWEGQSLQMLGRA